MKVFEWIKDLHSVCKFMSVEKPCTVASNSEIQRWIKDGSILVNSKRMAPNDELVFPVTSLVLFPKSQQRRTTVW